MTKRKDFIAVPPAAWLRFHRTSCFDNPSGPLKTALLWVSRWHRRGRKERARIFFAIEQHAFKLLLEYQHLLLLRKIWW
jgi:hypothetical protein